MSKKPLRKTHGSFLPVPLRKNSQLITHLSSWLFTRLFRIILVRQQTVENVITDFAPSLPLRYERQYKKPICTSHHPSVPISHHAQS